MVIIQKHGKTIPSAGQLQNYQFGWYDGDNKEEGSLKGDLYIGIPGKDPVKITASAETRLNKTIDEKFELLNSKINKGSLHSDNITHFLSLTEGSDVSDSIKVGDQWVITAEDDSNTREYNLKDTYLYVVEELANDATYTENDYSDGYASNSENAKIIDAIFFNVGNGKKLVAKRGPIIEYSFHEVQSAIPEYTDYDAGDAEGFNSENHGIVVFGGDNVKNTVEIDLAPKTKKLLRDIDDLGIVGGGSGNSPFAGGFMTKIEKVELGDGKVNDDVKEKSAIYITYKAQRKQEDGSFKEVTVEPVVVDLNDLVIDEGEW